MTKRFSCIQVRFLVGFTKQSLWRKTLCNTNVESPDSSSVFEFFGHVLTICTGFVRPALGLWHQTLLFASHNEMTRLAAKDKAQNMRFGLKK